MGTGRVRWVLVLGLCLAATAAAQPLGYRWVDEQGQVHYAGRRDQVPEQYRSQLAPEGPGEPPRPHLPAPPRSAQIPAPGECQLRLRGTAARAGSTRSYPSCEACWKALAHLSGEEARRGECIANSVKSYR